MNVLSIIFFQFRNIVGNVKSYARNCFGIWWEFFTGGGLTAPWLPFSGQNQRVKGGGTPLVLPLTICGLAAITLPEARSPRHPGASYSCISCCPIGFRPHDEAGRRPTSTPNFRPGRHRAPASCTGSPDSSAQLYCLYGFWSNALMESLSKSWFPQCQPLLSLQSPVASWPLARQPRRQPSHRMPSCSLWRGSP